jgi:hypothetical protein
MASRIAAAQRDQRHRAAMAKRIRGMNCPPFIGALSLAPTSIEAE